MSFKGMAARLLMTFILTFAMRGEVYGAVNLAVIGDSYSTFKSGAGADDVDDYYPYWSTIKGNDVTEKGQSWVMLFAEEINAKRVYKDAVSGSEITSRGEDDARSILNRIIHSPKNIGDVIVLMGGLNDTWEGRSIGSTESSAVTIKNTNKFAPALSFALRELKKKNKDAVIIYALNLDEKGSIPYLEAARTVCEKENVCFAPIGGIECVSSHPNKKGMKQIASLLSVSYKKASNR